MGISQLATFKWHRRVYPIDLAAHADRKMSEPLPDAKERIVAADLAFVEELIALYHPYLTYPPPTPPFKIINHNYFNGPIPLFDSSKKAIDIWK